MPRPLTRGGDKQSEPKGHPAPPADSAHPHPAHASWVEAERGAEVPPKLPADGKVKPYDGDFGKVRERRERRRKKG